jgi:two-component system, chemotaxis family, CheB/CheR fusion protein
VEPRRLLRKEETVSVHRILIVDDYVPASQALTRLLRLNGHVVESAPDAEKAMAIALEFRPEVVLLDINLGGDEDGLAIARWMRVEARLEGVLLVAVTGRCDFEIKDRIAAAGFDHYLVKPIPVADIENIMLDADAR